MHNEELKKSFLEKVEVGEATAHIGVGCWPNLRASYLELVDLFGEPNCEGDGMESDCGWEFCFEGVWYNLYNKEDGVASMGYEGIPTDYLDEWHIWSSESDPHLRKQHSDRLRAILQELCPMEKYPEVKMGEVFAAKKNITNLSQRGLVQVMALIDHWTGDIFPDRRTDEEIMSVDEQEK